MIGTNKPAITSSRKADKYRGVKCLNCGHPLDLSDVYCSYCSQLNTTKKLSLKDFFNEFLSNIISYDSRFRQTLATLVFKPGIITKDFVEGQRKKFANPFRFYLSVSIIFFIIYGAINSFDEDDFIKDGDNIKLNNGFVDLQEKIKDSTTINNNIVAFDSIVSEASGESFSLDSILSDSKGEKISLDSIIKKSIKKDTVKKTYKDSYYSEASLDSLGFFESFGKRFMLYREFNKETKIDRTKKAFDSLKHKRTRYNNWMYKKASATNDINQIGGLLSYFTKQLPLIIFFFLPIFALFVWLLYIRRKFTYTDHLIFLFHTQTMFFVLYTIAIIIDAIFKTKMATNIASLVFLFYLYKALRNFYQQGRIKTIVKFMILNSIFFILATIGATIAFLISFATY